jgi:hypothetical protein
MRGMFWSVSTRLNRLPWPCPGRPAVHGLDHVVAGAFQGEGHHLADGGRVVDGKYGQSLGDAAGFGSQQRLKACHSRRVRGVALQGLRQRGQVPRDVVDGFGAAPAWPSNWETMSWNCRAVTARPTWTSTSSAIRTKLPDGGSALLVLLLHGA